MIDLGTFFDDDDPRWSTRAPRERELFRRAYGDRFEQVIHRLGLGFSLLVYLPGNCMRAAASMAREQLAGFAWNEYCHDVGGSANIEELWTGAKGIAAKLGAWLEDPDSHKPAAIFHNLDQLADSSGRGVYSSTGARTLVASLVQATRGGVVLGLAEREAGPLPEDLARVFPESIHLEHVPLERFPGCVPLRLAQGLADTQELNDGAMRALAARLRWTDPIRLHAILKEAAQRSSGLADVLARILESTRPVHFVDLGPADPGNERPSGFPASVVTTLDRYVIRPFRKWTTFSGDPDAFERAARRLPPGVVLHGPPGTGKTGLAKWIVGRIGLPARIVSGSQIRSKGWGDAEKAVRSLFRELRRAAPCVLILDDADDLLPARDDIQGGLASAERAVVNEFLQQLEGIDGRLEGILVILTTNRYDALDRASVHRLSIDLRVPYPVEEEQLRAIVGAAAGRLGFVLEPAIEAALITSFWRSRDRQLVAEDRSQAEDGLFSPREIETAMRFLQDTGRESELGAIYRPTTADVARMKAHYDPDSVRTSDDE